MSKLCILAAGQGTRCTIYKGLHKGLYPINNLPIISYIIEKVDVPIVIAIGYLGEQLKTFLQSAYPEKNITFVKVDNWYGPGSGPGYSLLKCKSELSCPFIFTTIDTITNNLDLDLNENWAGVNDVGQNPRKNYSYFHNGQINYERGTKAFTGIAGVKDFEKFWVSLSHPDIKKGEHQVLADLSSIHPVERAHEWLDTGDDLCYEKAIEAFHATKKNHNSFYQIKNKVIKFFETDGEARDTHRRYEFILPELNCKLINPNMICYDYIEGETFTTCCNEYVQKDFLVYLKDFLKRGIQGVTIDFLKNCDDMYLNKTLIRLKSYKGFEIDNIQKINGDLVPPVEVLLDRINWYRIRYHATPYHFHGDIQPENIIRTRRGFSIIDPRRSFGDSPNIGDIYYDLGKLYHGLLINPKTGRDKDYKVKIGKEAEVSVNYNKLLLDFKTKFEIFCHTEGYDWQTIEILGALQFITISPLYFDYDPEYSQFLFLYGKHYLNTLLNKYDK